MVRSTRREMENGQLVEACFSGASRSVWHSFHSWRAWSPPSEEARARQTGQREREGWKTRGWACDFVRVRRIRISYTCVVYVCRIRVSYTCIVYVCLCARSAATRWCARPTLIQCPPLFNRLGARVRYSAFVHSRIQPWASTRVHAYARRGQVSARSPCARVLPVSTRSTKSTPGPAKSEGTRQELPFEWSSTFTWRYERWFTLIAPKRSCYKKCTGPTQKT